MKKILSRLLILLLVAPVVGAQEMFSFPSGSTSTSIGVNEGVGISDVSNYSNETFTMQSSLAKISYSSSSNCDLCGGYGCPDCDSTINPSVGEATVPIGDALPFVLLLLIGYALFRYCNLKREKESIDTPQQ